MAPIFEDDFNLDQHFLNPNNENELEKITTILKKFPSVRTKPELKSLFLLLQEIDLFADFFKEMPDITCLELLKTLKCESAQKGQTLFNIGDNERYSYVILKGSVFTLGPKSKEYLDLRALENNFDLASEGGGSPARSETRSMTLSPKRKGAYFKILTLGQQPEEGITSIPNLHTLKDIPECDPFDKGSLEALSPLRKNKTQTVVWKTEKSHTRLASLNFSNGLPLFPEEANSMYPDYRISGMLENGAFFGQPSVSPNGKRDGIVVARESCVFLVMDIRSYRQMKVQHEEKVYQETLEFFKMIPLTKEWSNMSLISLLRQCKTLQLIKNNVVYNIGDAVDCVYFIKQGEIEIVKDAAIELNSDELLPKQNISQRGTLNFDRMNMLDVNSAWKRKFVQKHTQQVKVALIGANQTFGEEEFVEKKPTRQFRAIVKSSSAELLYVSFTKLIENAKNPEKFLERLSKGGSKTKWRQSFETDVVEITQNNPSEKEIYREKEAKKKPYINLFNVSSGFKMQDAQDRKNSFNTMTQITSEDLPSGTTNKLLLKQKDKRGSMKDLSSLMIQPSRLLMSAKNPNTPKSPTSKTLHKVTTSHIFTEASITKTTAPGSLLYDALTPKRGPMAHSPRFSPIKMGSASQNMSPITSPIVSPDTFFIINKGSSRISTFTPKNYKPRTAAPVINFSTMSPQDFSVKEDPFESTKLLTKSIALVSSNHVLFTEEKQFLQVEDGYDPKMLHTKLGLSRILNDKPKSPSHKHFPAQFLVKSPTAASIKTREEVMNEGSMKDIFSLLNAPKIKVNTASPKVIMSIKKKMKSQNNSLSLSQALFPAQFPTSSSPINTAKRIPKESVSASPSKKSIKKRAPLSIKIDRKFSLATLETIDTQMQDLDRKNNEQITVT